MCRPPLSTKSYISFVTTSVASPMRWKTPKSSSNGEITWPYPAASTTEAKTVTNCRQRADSGGRMSRIPGLVWNSGMSNKAIGGAEQVSRLYQAPLTTHREPQNGIGGTTTTRDVCQACVKMFKLCFSQWAGRRMQQNAILPFTRFGHRRRPLALNDSTGRLGRGCLAHPVHIVDDRRL